MKRHYQCEVCSKTFSLLRYLRKHISAVTDEEPNKCIEFYRQQIISNPNLKPQRFRVPVKISDDINVETMNKQVVLLNSDSQQHTTVEDDDKKDEHFSLKFEPDEEDQLYFFTNEKPISPDMNTQNILKQHLASTKSRGTNVCTRSVVDNKNQDGTELLNSSLSARMQNVKSPETTSQLSVVNPLETTSTEATVKCKVCKLACPSLEDLCIHYETLHRLPMVFLVRRGLKKHKKLVHTREAVQCDICQKPFRLLQHLTRHKLSVHDGVRYKCDVCAKTFSRLENLNEHKRSTHDGVPYKCNICQKQFTHVQHLKQHKLSVHNKVKHTCDICQKKFAHVKCLHRHKLSIHDGVKYTCDICKKQYTQLESLRQHKLVVHDGVRYKCDVCAKTFRWLKYLKEHKRSTHDGVPHKCNICQKQFAHVKHLKRHKLSVHGGSCLLQNPA